jgi:hypothetical protein
MKWDLECPLGEWNYNGNSTPPHEERYHGICDLVQVLCVFLEFLAVVGNCRQTQSLVVSLRQEIQQCENFLRHNRDSGLAGSPLTSFATA